eukprot:TRINITY_DN26183_c0_g1_i1.p1 TRINITY_DN26183_c0_g1~~TRINITY_DN26183_c0_g1_i1.p1  ORF type:complete len:452 (+),score=70.90 TRINITY_DN26183_c0_g1_i1:113-1468(+)
MGLSCSKRDGYDREEYTPVPPEETGDKPAGVSEEDWDLQVASAHLSAYLRGQNKGDMLGIESDSVYGAAFAIPQLARSAGWPEDLTAAAVNSYFFLALNIFLQGFLLYMVSKEERVVSNFAGQMHLCNFGAGNGNTECPSAPDCLGPGGTQVQARKLFSYDVWSTRTFFRDVLLELFPEKGAEIAEVDPGEFGLESYYLRFACCFLFIAGVWPELYSVSVMLQILYHLPNVPEPWLAIEKTVENPEDTVGKAHHHMLGRARIRLAGMSPAWKAVTLIVVWAPKLFLWLLLVDIGTVFLMETSVIEEMIINAVALVFVLSIDEMLAAAVFPSGTKNLLMHVEGLYLSMAEPSVKEIVEENEKLKRWKLYHPGTLRKFVPTRLVAMMGVCFFFVAKYYNENCLRRSDGSWVSTDLYLPTTHELSFLSFVFGPLPMVFPTDVGDTPMWQMSDAL